MKKQNLVFSLGIGLCALLPQGFAEKRGEISPTVISRYVAIDNVCAWPNLTTLPDGTIIATIHNQPSHGGMEGQVECWASQDGQFWERRGFPAPNEPHTVRLNVAVGIGKNGDLIVLCSGWTDVKQSMRPKQDAFRDTNLMIWVCRSSDGGRTWSQVKEFPAPREGRSHYMPFGPIVTGADGALHVSGYNGELAEPTKSFRVKPEGYSSWHFRSEDDGRTWNRVAMVGPVHNETTLLRLEGQKWLAAARSTSALDLFTSADDGVTWQGPQRVTEKKQYPAHLLRLTDGRLLMAYGNRAPGQFGVMAKLSTDEGRTWGEPIRLAKTLIWDGGYPSSVQRPDGKIVTAYYTKQAENHERYHMAVAIWELPVKE